MVTGRGTNLGGIAIHDQREITDLEQQVKTLNLYPSSITPGKCYEESKAGLCALEKQNQDVEPDNQVLEKQLADSLHFILP
jgi:hypothetical protein